MHYMDKGIMSHPSTNNTQKTIEQAVSFILFRVKGKVSISCIDLRHKNRVINI